MIINSIIAILSISLISIFLINKFKFKKVEYFYLLLCISTVFFTQINQQLYFFHYLLITDILLIVFWEDYFTKKIPDFLNYSAIIIALSKAYFEDVLSLALISGVIAFLFYYLTALTFYKIRKKKGLGGGDIKLITALGIFLGIESIFVITFLAAILTLFLSLLRREDSRRIPFGPGLVYASYIFIIFRSEIISLIY